MFGDLCKPDEEEDMYEPGSFMYNLSGAWMKKFRPATTVSQQSDAAHGMPACEAQNLCLEGNHQEVAKQPGKKWVKDDLACVGCNRGTPAHINIDHVVYKLCCTHRICINCVKNVKKEAECPKCKANIGKNDVKTIYLKKMSETEMKEKNFDNF